MKVMPQKTAIPDYGPRRLTVELTNICNLHCSYCLRDEDALYHSPADFLSVELFARIARDARDSMGIEQVMFTGGEPTLHPDFGKLLAAVAALDLKCSFVTNGWHFERVWPLLSEHRMRRSEFVAILCPSLRRLLFLRRAWVRRDSVSPISCPLR